MRSEKEIRERLESINDIIKMIEGLGIPHLKPLFMFFKISLEWVLNDKGGE